MRIYQEITELIGGTPLMKLGHYGEKHQLTATLMAKLEYLNPAGSVKDRVALAMLSGARRGESCSPARSSLSPPAGIPASDWLRWLPPGDTA